MSNYVIGVDIGGSHITAAIVDLDIKNVVRNTVTRCPVNSADEAAQIIRLWCDTIQRVGPGNLDEVRIGIAMPGPFDYEAGVSYIKGLDKYENLYGLNIKELMADMLGISASQILMNNDAACFLHGEMFAGAGRGSTTSIGITLGTGTGTAVHHMGVTKDANLGPSPFLDSIADNYLSTRWFVNEYERCSGKRLNDVQEIARRCETDPAVAKLFGTFARNLAQLISDFARRENPRIVVMGGNIANASELFLDDVQEILSSKGIHLPIMKATLGENANLLGAASLFTSVGRIVA